VALDEDESTSLAGEALLAVRIGREPGDTVAREADREAIVAHQKRDLGRIDGDADTRQCRCDGSRVRRNPLDIAHGRRVPLASRRLKVCRLQAGPGAP
jgi:hypothetical protein